jgi:hypothetical protein
MTNKITQSMTLYKINLECSPNKMKIIRIPLKLGEKGRNTLIPKKKKNLEIKQIKEIKF